MNKEHTVDRFLQLMQSIGRRSSLRDPMASALQAEFSGPQLHALMWLGVEGPLTMGDLAQRSGATEKTITGIVDRLEREGLVKRVRDDADRRVVRVELTRKGKSAHDVILGEVREKLAGFLAFLDDKDRSDLFRILQHVSQKLEAMTSASHPQSSRASVL